MKAKLAAIFLHISISVFSQTNYGTPNDHEIPDKLANIERAIVINHFPMEVDPIKIKETYYWKHNTSILTKTNHITIKEYGAFIYYNNKWNLRQTYPLKEFDDFFGTKNERLVQGQPYTWKNNWRTGTDLFAGWALWYVIGITDSGKTVCGYQTLYTTNNLLNK